MGVCGRVKNGCMAVLQHPCIPFHTPLYKHLYLLVWVILVSRGTFSRLQYLAWQYIPECVCVCVHVVGKTDVLLVTSLRDGMNLVSYEFVACQNEKKGVLVLSEVSSCAFTFSFPFPF